ncbi:MAG: branched-chain amino acid ABC transporter permease [Bacteroidales bacterium]|nr:branched-chain amino acid ABC transporter permease [Bacteroidales bacterium]
MIWQFIVNGIISGTLYSLLAIGFALVYNTTKLFHITAAAIYVFAAYMFYLFSVVINLPVLLAATVAISLTMALSLLTDVSVYRPLKRRKASNNVAMIASIGMMTVIVNLLAMFFGNETKVIDNTIHRTFAYGSIIITTPQMWQLVVGGIVIASFLLFITKSQWGIRFRALSANSTLYETLGYSTTHARIFVFLLSGLFIAVASCLTVYDIGLDPHMGMTVLINAMVAMIIGGVGRFGTCVVGGLVLGVIQALTVWQFSSNWQNAVTFVLLLILLFIRPQGIAGYKQRAI